MVWVINNSSLKNIHKMYVVIYSCPNSRYLFTGKEAPAGPHWQLWELSTYGSIQHDDVIKCKLFPRYWPFVRGIHRSPVNSPHKGQWRGALMFSLICVWISGWVNNHEAGDLRRYRGHCDVIVMNASRKNLRLEPETLGSLQHRPNI